VATTNHTGILTATHTLGVLKTAKSLLCFVYDGYPKMYEWQMKILADIETGGLKPGEMMIISSGRQIGKSVYKQYVQEWYNNMIPPFTKIDSARVDGQPWYTVKCRREVASWIRSQPEDNRWREYIDNDWYLHGDTFDVCEQVYIELGLKFA
jgi:hypothetical protein